MLSKVRGYVFAIVQELFECPVALRCIAFVAENEDVVISDDVLIIQPIQGWTPIMHMPLVTKLPIYLTSADETKLSVERHLIELFRRNLNGISSSPMP
jgi:hypothetical protein